MKILGTGTFGCVVSPAIPCIDKRKIKSGYITKIIHQKPLSETTDNEFSISKTLQIIGKKQKIPVNDYFCLVQDICKTDQTKFTKKFKNSCPHLFQAPIIKSEAETIYDCEFECGFKGTYSQVEEHEKSCIKNPKNAKKSKKKKKGGSSSTDEKIYISYILPNCGSSLGSYISKIKKSKKLLISLIHNLLLGLEVLKNNNIIHGDIKAENILIKNNKSRLIDFGGSVNLNEIKYKSKNKLSLKKIIKEMTNTNFHIPPEYVFFDICIDDKELSHKEYLKNYDNERFLGMLYEGSGYDVENKLLEQDGEKEKNELIKFFNSLKTKSKFDKFMKEYIHSSKKSLIFKYDVYSLGKILEFIVLENEIKLDKKIKDLIVNMTKLDCKQRYSVEQCLKSLE